MNVYSQTDNSNEDIKGISNNDPIYSHFNLCYCVLLNRFLDKRLYILDDRHYYSIHLPLFTLFNLTAASKIILKEKYNENTYEFIRL